MKAMFIKTVNHLFCFLLITKISFAQIPVREEPRHHVAFQNQYIRLLDVRLPPHDTTLFHVHEIPSLFVVLSKTLTASQIKDSNWVNGTFTSNPGYAWYNNFKSGPLIHRVANTDTVPFHVMDIEILSNYNKNNLAPLAFDTLFTCEKAFAYNITLSGEKDKKQIINRGPIVAIVVSGSINVHFTDNETKTVDAGKFIFIEPKTKWWFQNKNNNKTSIVAFELK